MTLLGRVLTKCAKISGFIIQSTAIAYCVVEFCGGLVICSGSSMEPTIQNNDIILTEQVSVHMHNIRRGDIIVAKCPTNPRQYICKRVVAVYGDDPVSVFSMRKVCRCIAVGLALGADTPRSLCRIPRGHVWLEGDNKGNSTDSRVYGPVPLGLVRGRAVCRVWPYHRATFFGAERS
ncbi:inner membrane protease subunit IMP-1, putative [Ixodes scapularis]|uniref:Mitochondrial inner membrane protease subunit n=1 Tax=Ixodes scapularis TaxID=6945 RepID=B7QNL4_IXOSC|nr:inner membrane protease subunit IMP-1, putative [Ixodes scapularis]|eukprot:XP_002416519.1 inner membrane protease subunit IMP-1, putative [Ixodes scapularis]